MFANGASCLQLTIDNGANPQVTQKIVLNGLASLLMKSPFHSPVACRSYIFVHNCFVSFVCSFPVFFEKNKYQITYLDIRYLNTIFYFIISLR